MPGVNGSDPGWGSKKGYWFADSMVDPLGPNALDHGAQVQFGKDYQRPVPRKGGSTWFTFAATVGPSAAVPASYAHFINGVEEMRDVCCKTGVPPNDDPENPACSKCASPLVFAPHKTGRMSLGVRINDICHFKGVIAAIKLTPRVLSAHELMRPPS